MKTQLILASQQPDEYSAPVKTACYRGLVAVVAEVSSFFSRLHRYREYLKQSVLRDLRIKYKRSVLGYLWTMLHPLGMMVVLAVVFSQIMRFPIKDYAVFLFCGILVWNYFHLTVMVSLVCIRMNAKIFEQVPMPTYLFVVSVAISNLVNLVLAIIPLFALMLAFGRPIPMTVLALPGMILPIFVLTLGVSLFLAAITVFYDDVKHITEVVLQALYFLCPVLYSRDVLPASLVDVLALNPLFMQIEFFRQIFYDGTLPMMSVYWLNLGLSFLVFLIGLKVFVSSERKFLYFI